MDKEVGLEGLSVLMRRSRGRGRAAEGRAVDILQVKLKVLIVWTGAPRVGSTTTSLTCAEGGCIENTELGEAWCSAYA